MHTRYTIRYHWLIDEIVQKHNMFLFFSQTSDQRADGPAQPRPFAAVQHQAATHSRPDHTAPSHTLFAHIARIRQSSDRRRTHGNTGILTKQFYTFCCY